MGVGGVRTTFFEFVDGVVIVVGHAFRQTEPIDAHLRARMQCQTYTRVKVGEAAVSAHLVAQCQCR
jgi:hypothetical protein